MKENDPIEELFQQRSKESVGEKPRDLVWNRIESGLQNNKTKKRTIQQFVSSVWFSAAVFALIAIPYFVFFIENLNTLDKNESIEIVKINNFSDEQLIERSNDLNNIEEVKIKESKPLILAKNKSVKELKIISVQHIEENSIPSSEKIIDNKLSKTTILDSLESNGMYAASPRMRLNTKETKDSLNFKNLDESLSLSTAYYKQRNTKSIKNTQSVDFVSPKESSISILEESIKNNLDSENDIDVKIIYKPLKFTAKTKILRTNFKLLNRSKSAVSFVNNSIIISFVKTNNGIVFKTNEPNMSTDLLNLLENNKKEIFNNYHL